MKKVLPIIIAVLIVIVCCITAGCTASPTDPIIGSWVATQEENGTTLIFTQVFSSDGTGLANTTKTDGTITTEKFDWFNMGSVYTFIYGNGTSASITYDKNSDTLRAPSGLIFARQTNKLN